MVLYVANEVNPMKKTVLYTAGDERKVFNGIVRKRLKKLFLLLATN